MNTQDRTLHRWCQTAIAVALIALSTTTARSEWRLFGNLYQQTTAVTTIRPPDLVPCNDTDVCHFFFERLPDDRSLQVTQVSCRIDVGGKDIDNLFVGSLRKNGKPHLVFMSLDVGEKKNGIYTLNTQTFQLIGGNEIPVIRLRLNGKGDVTGVCSVAGYVGNE
jgi:hypothetical protein